MRKSFNKKQTIFAEGDAGDGFYLVISGRVKVFKISREGKEQILHIIGPGEPFGEVPVFPGRISPPMLRQWKKSNRFSSPRRAFIDLIKKNPSLAMNMLAVLSVRLRRFSALVEDLSLKEVPGRLSAYLLYLSETGDRSPHLTLDIIQDPACQPAGNHTGNAFPHSGPHEQRREESGSPPRGKSTIKILDRERLKALAGGARPLA